MRIYCSGLDFLNSYQIYFAPSQRAMDHQDIVRTYKPLETWDVPYNDKSFLQPARPTFTLTKEEAQQLLEELWRNGVRPLSGEGNVGQLAATNKHLEDMRSLVWRAMNMESGVGSPRPE